jgi:hypothetical protein
LILSLYPYVLFPSIDVYYYRYLPFQPMAKKRTAEEYHQTTKANSWVEGAYEEEDRVVLEREGPSDRYKANQQEALD